MTFQEIKEYLTENDWVETTNESDIAGFIKDDVFLTITSDIDAVQNLFAESKIYPGLTFSIAFLLETFEDFESRIFTLTNLIYWEGN